MTWKEAVVAQSTLTPLFHGGTEEKKGNISHNGHFSWSRHEPRNSQIKVWSVIVTRYVPSAKINSCLASPKIPRLE